MYLDDLRRAHAVIQPYIVRTPVLTCPRLDELLGAKIFLKCENLQHGGAFKARGACHAVFTLTTEQAARGVVTHSSGNHATALARAASLRGIPAHIVMPRTAPQIKVALVEYYGGNITFCEPTQAARESAASQIVEQTGATFIHPYDDERIIAGQGTAALELLEEVPDLDVVMAPVGGGGLLGGTLIAVKQSVPEKQVWAGEPELANDAYLGWKSGERQPQCPPRSIADGLLTNVGERNFSLLQRYLDHLLLAREETIVDAVWKFLEWVKIVVEPSGAVPLAALMDHPDQARGKRIGMILSGGNLDLRGFVGTSQ